jgi:hypothetical protein
LKEAYDDLTTTFNQDVLDKAKEIPKDYHLIKEEEVNVLC